MRDPFSELKLVLDTGKPCVFCSVVETKGSTPQKAGAVMLVFPDGSQAGTLGGGCVEAEVKQQALRGLHTGLGQPEVVTFTLDDNYGWDDGLICGGRMSILTDPLWANPAASASYYRIYTDLVQQGKGCTEAVVLQASLACLPVGSRYLFDASQTLVAQLAPLPPSQAIVARLIPLQKRPGPSTQQGIAYLPVLPRVTLLIVGGGHVGQAVAKLAAEVDFDIWVLDDRARYVSEERFPQAQKRLVGEIGPTLKELVPNVHAGIYCLIVTRGHNHDEEALYHLAPTSAGYVGMIGSKRKIKLIYEDLLSKNISAEVLKQVHAPLGFAIGSQTVGEIAVSIVAELIAVRNLGHTLEAARIRVLPDTLPT